MQTRWWITGAVFLAVALAGCAGDDGKDGTNGTDGADGPMGPPGTAQCMQCHDDDYSLENYLGPIQAEFEESQHNLGDTYLRRGSETSPTCARCHTTEGHQKYLATGEATPVTESSPITCFTCHAPHTNMNFDLRKQNAVALDLGGIYDKGTSNACAVCHQVRPPNPAITDVATPIRSSRWGPHHGPQGNLLNATGAHVFPGGTGYPVSAHGAAADGCVTCHMATVPADNMAGGHSFKVLYGSDADRIVSGGCTTAGCHPGVTDQSIYADEVAPFQEELAVELAAIRTLLVNLGWLNPDTGLLTASQDSPLALPSADDRGAIFNFLLLEDDRSEGVHNPRYAMAVARATREYLETR